MSDREDSGQSTESTAAGDETLDTGSSKSKGDQPGLAQLRAAVAEHLQLPRPKRLRDDAIAGLSIAAANVPDGMANGLLVGVNPIHGLYATMIGPFVGGLTSSSQLMVITTTAAASLTAGQSLAGASGQTRATALFVLVVMAGTFQIAFAMLGLGRLTRFVSYSVLTGFLAGISLLLVLSQLPTVTGYEANGSNRVSQTLDLAAHVRAMHPATIGVAPFTLVLAVLLPRTRLGSLGRLIAIVLPSALVAYGRLEGVRIVGELGDIPGKPPTSEGPSLIRFAPLVLTGALSVALVVLVQGVGVGQSVPKREGEQSSVRRDIIAQGAANVVSGLFKGLPVGGSLSATAIGVIAGARTRWASLIAGLAMAVIVIAVPDLVELVAMPSLGALLILAGLGGLRPAEILAVARTGWPSLLAASTTFLATLFLPIQAAVGLGVVLSALLYVGATSADVEVVELVRRPDGSVEERVAPSRLKSQHITTLEIHGNLSYAGARALEQRLPTVEDSHRAVVVLRLRGRETLGATPIDVLARYARAIQSAGGRVYLSGIGEHAYEQLVRTGKLRLDGPVRVHEATPVLGESTRDALADAEAWLINADGGSNG